MRWRLSLVALLVLAILITGCARTAQPNPTPPQPPAPGPTPVADPIAELMAKMSADEKVAQLFMVGFVGKTAPSELEVLLKSGVGGVILFAHNLDNPEQTARLTQQLQSAAQQSHLKIPLLISSDHEGGIVTRLTEGVTVFPGLMALGATGSTDYARQYGRISGEELRSLGINMNLAPVLDVNNNPNNPVIGVRSLGENPQEVARLGVELIKGLQEGKVAAVGKHFPGHGDTSVDSHLALPTVAHPRSRLDQVELVPFKAAIEAGVDAIMAAHVFFPAIETTPELPSTLSPAVLTGLLRDQLGFKGVIITDDMEMNAIRNSFTPGEAAVRAVKAGTDIVLMASRPSDHQAALQAVQQAVKDGQIGTDRLNQSVRRVLELKQRYGLLQSVQIDPAQAKAQVGTATNRAAAQKIADDSITLIRDQAKTLPIKPTASTLVIDLDTENPNPTPIYSALKGRISQLRSVVWDVIPTAAQRTQGIELARNADLVIIASYNAHLYPVQAAAIMSVVEASKASVLVAIRNPYDAATISSAPTALATYNSQDVSFESLRKVLLGEIPAKGKLPVTVK